MKRVLFALLLATSVQADEIDVAAASSLQDALQAVGRVYQAKTGDTLVYNFGGSNALARQIKAGAPADVFFSADEATMATVDTTLRRDILGNRLKILGDLRSARRVALANPAAVPAGVYAKQYLERAGLWAAVAPKVIPTENVRAALAAFEGGNVDAAIVYATDAPALPGVIVEGKLAPEIRYPAAMVKDARHPAAARRFVEFLTSAEATAIFRRFGFPPAPRPASSRSAGTTSTRPVRSKS